MALDKERKKSAVHTRWTQEDPWTEEHAPANPRVGGSTGSRAGAGEEPPALLGLPEKS